jgi:hypothetical protein
VRREPHPLAPTLARQLCTLLSFSQAQRFPGGLPARFDDELRALAVLYRYKVQPGTPPVNRTVVPMAVDNRAALDTLDLALATEMLDASLLTPVPPQFARDAAAPWLDWAIGELGQIEKGSDDPAKSNPGILEYLKAAGVAGQGDKTPWCAAFVTWVIEQTRADPTVNAVGPPLNAPPPKPEAATSWIGWGRTPCATWPARSRPPLTTPRKADTAACSGPNTRRATTER